MQPLIKLTNVERAKLLFELIPVEIPAFIVFEKFLANKIIRDKKTIEKDWDMKKTPFAFPFWLSLAEDAVNKIEKNDKQLAANSRRFSDQLFDGYNAFFSVHCLLEFTKSAKCISKKFALFVDVLFSFE
jgi:hypothetical protein